jgi:Cys-tRNA(Pro)/Cys-tRNA(Cys) deacylase
MKTLDKLRAIFNHNNADYTLFKDKIPLKTANTGVTEYGIHLSEAAPTLIIKIDEGIIAAIIRGDTRISFKKLKDFLKITRIRLAKPEEIYNITGAKVGDVALINEGVKTFMDKKILENTYVYGGCGIPNHTLKIKVIDLVKITHATVLDFTHVKTNANASR